MPSNITQNHSPELNNQQQDASQEDVFKLLSDVTEVITKGSQEKKDLLMGIDINSDGKLGDLDTNGNGVLDSQDITPEQREILVKLIKNEKIFSMVNNIVKPMIEGREDTAENKSLREGLERKVDYTEYDLKNISGEEVDTKILGIESLKEKVPTFLVDNMAGLKKFHNISDGIHNQTTISVPLSSANKELKKGSKNSQMSKIDILDLQSIYIGGNKDIQNLYKTTLPKGNEIHGLNKKNQALFESVKLSNDELENNKLDTLSQRISLNQEGISISNNTDKISLEYEIINNNAINITENIARTNNKINDLSMGKDKIQYFLNNIKTELLENPNNNRLKEITTILDKKVNQIEDQKLVIQNRMDKILMKKEALQKKSLELDIQMTKNNKKMESLLVSSKLLSKQYEKSSKTILEKATKEYEKIHSNSEKIQKLRLDIQNASIHIKDVKKNENDSTKNEILSMKESARMQLKKYQLVPNIHDKYIDLMSLIDSSLEDNQLSDEKSLWFFDSEKEAVSKLWEELQNEIITEQEKFEKKEKEIQGEIDEIEQINSYIPQNLEKTDTQSILNNSKKLQSQVTINTPKITKEHFTLFKVQASKTIIRDIYKNTLIEKEKYDGTIPEGISNQYNTIKKQYTEHVNSENSTEEISNFSRLNNKFLSTLSQSLEGEDAGIQLREEKISLKSGIQKIISTSNSLSGNTQFYNLFNKLYKGIDNIKSFKDLADLESLLDLDNEDGFFVLSVNQLGSASKSIYDLNSEKLNNEYNKIVQSIGSIVYYQRTKAYAHDTEKINQLIQEEQNKVRSMIKELEESIITERSELVNESEQKEGTRLISSLSKYKYKNEDFQELINKKISTYSSKNNDEKIWLTKGKITKEQFAVIKKIVTEFDFLDTTYSIYSGSDEFLEDISMDILDEKTFTQNISNTQNEIKKLFINSDYSALDVVSSEGKDFLVNKLNDTLWWEYKDIGQEKEITSILYNKDDKPKITNPYILQILIECESLNEIKDVQNILEEKKISLTSNFNYDNIIQKITNNAVNTDSEKINLDAKFGTESYKHSGLQNTKYLIKSIRALTLAKAKVGGELLYANESIEKLMVYAHENNKFQDIYQTILHNSEFSLTSIFTDGDISHLEKKSQNENIILAEERLGRYEETGDYKRFNDKFGKIFLYCEDINGAPQSIGLEEFSKQLNSPEYKDSDGDLLGVMKNNKQATISLLNYIVQYPYELNKFNNTVKAALFKFLKIEQNKSNNLSHSEKIFADSIGVIDLFEQIGDTDLAIELLLGAINDKTYNFSEIKGMEIKKSKLTKIQFDASDEGKRNLASTLNHEKDGASDNHNQLIEMNREIEFNNDALLIESLLLGEVNVKKPREMPQTTFDQFQRLGKTLVTMLPSPPEVTLEQRNQFVKSVTEGITSNPKALNGFKAVYDSAKNILGKNLRPTDADALYEIFLSKTNLEVKGKIAILKKRRINITRGLEEGDIEIIDKELEKLSEKLSNTANQILQNEIQTPELKTAKVNHTTGKHVDDQAVEDSYRNNPKYQKKLENQKRTEQRIKEQTEKYNAYLNSGDPEKIAEAQRWFTNDGNDAWRNVDISLGDTAKVIKESAKKLADSGFITKEQYHKIVKQSTEVIKNVPENNNVENYDINSEYQNGQVIIQNGISSTFHKDNSGYSSIIPEKANQDGKYNAKLIGANGKIMEVSISQKEKEQIKNIEGAAKEIFDFYQFFEDVGLSKSIKKYKEPLLKAYGTLDISTDGMMNKAELLKFSNFILTIFLGKQDNRTKNNSLSFAMLHLRSLTQYHISDDIEMGLNSEDLFEHTLRQKKIIGGGLGFNIEALKKAQEHGGILESNEKQK